MSRFEIDREELRQLRDAGLSMEGIAELLGTTKSVVSKRCIEYGIVYGKGQSPANKRANNNPSRRDLANLPPIEPIEKREAAFIERLANDERTAMYEYVGGYSSMRGKVTVRCKSCGELRETTPKDLFSPRYDHHVCFNCLRIERERADEGRRRAWAAHQAEEYAKEKVCKFCGSVYHSEYDSSAYCSKKCKQASKRLRKDNSHRKRARKFGVEYDKSITWQSLSAELGHLNCQICGEPCDTSDTSWNGLFGPLYPTVDCIVAMKNGGGYVRGNVQLAHAICNSAKRDLDDYEEISEAVSTYAPNGGRYERRNLSRAAENARPRYSGLDRQRGREPQHGPASAAVPRDDTRYCRVGGR